MTKKILTYIILSLLIPVVIILGCTVFREKQYSFITLTVAILSCTAFFLSLEKRERSARTLTLISVFTALCIVSRIIFAPLQGFKPVTALVIIAGLHFGSEAGFTVGAMTALISNFYFAQGPWTPFQMLSWGVVGLVAGTFSKTLKKNKAWLLIYSAFAGILYSMLMDIYSVLWIDNAFNLSRYIATIITSLKFTITYAVSNVIFILIFAKPLGEKLERIKIKYMN